MSFLMHPLRAGVCLFLFVSLFLLLPVVEALSPQLGSWPADSFPLSAGMLTAGLRSCVRLGGYRRRYWLNFSLSEELKNLLGELETMSSS